MATAGSYVTKDYKILLMNCNGPSSDTKKRRKAFNKILQDLEPSIVFTQECAPGIYPYSDQYEQLRGYGRASNTGFIVNHDEFNALKLNIFSFPKAFLERLYSGASKDFEKYYDRDCPEGIGEKLKERVSIALLESIRVPSSQVLAVSWHGPHNGVSDDDKRMWLVYMISFVKNLHSLLGTPEGKQRTVLIGGDFNLPISKWPERVLGCFGYNIHMYSSEGGQSGNENRIDFFVSSTDFEVLSVLPHIVPPCSFTESRESSSQGDQTVGIPHVTYKESKTLFDHDPIQASISFPLVPDKGLSDALRRLSVSQNPLPSNPFVPALSIPVTTPVPLNTGPNPYTQPAQFNTVPGMQPQPYSFANMLNAAFPRNWPNWHP